MEMKELAGQLYFASEAADYLGISRQRLNRLVKDGVLTPLKRSSYGTLFHIDELVKRKEEMEYFVDHDGLELSGSFEIDSGVKMESLNFVTLMNALKMTEHKLDPLFSDFSQGHDVTESLVENGMVTEYASFFKCDEEVLHAEYEKALKAFQGLKSGDAIIKRGERDYPRLLMSTKQAPRFLYVRGRKELLHEDRTVALVGSRAASEKGKDNTRLLARVLGRHGITVVSGLARGIDVSSHLECLQDGHNTIAVIGTHLNQYYPKENEPVQRELEDRGLVVSQFSPATKTERWFFPLRNGVMSGMSLATVVMEAGETSGALKQADYALQQGRLLIIPEPMTRNSNVSWPREYVERGAKVAKDPTEVMRCLRESHILGECHGTVSQVSMEEYMNAAESAADGQQYYEWEELILEG